MGVVGVELLELLSRSALIFSQVSPSALVKWSSTDSDISSAFLLSSVHVAPRDLAKWSSTVLVSGR